MNYLDITGNVYGRLKAKEYIETINKKSYWWFECECGKVIRARADCVKTGTIRSCGCLHSESARNQCFNVLHKNDEHHDAGSKFYSTWQALKGRCNNPNDGRYKDYGGRGIKCEWNSYIEFKNDMYKSFLKHCKKYGEDNTSIDRIDNNGNYSKDNCRWATRETQCNNRRSNVIVEMIDGSKMTLSQYADLCSVKRSTMNARYKRSEYYGTKRIPESYLRKYLGDE